MNSNSNTKFNRKDYLFLTVCLIIYFIVIMFTIGYGNLPTVTEIIVTGIAVIISISIVLYVLKKLNDEQGL